MADIFDGDIGLFNKQTHGEFSVENGQPKMDQGLETAVFISLYSGKTDDFWGNELSVNPSFHYGGKYEPLAQELNATPENALRLIEAIKNDLNWMKDEGIASNIVVTAQIIGAKTINFKIVIFRPNEDSVIVEFDNNWTGQFKNPAHVGLE